MNPIASYQSSLSNPYGGRGLEGGFASQERALNAYSGTDAGLTIQTREGDIVTLNSSSYSELDAYEYSSQGVVRGEDGVAAATLHTREISLYNEESFSFSVQGDLNEQELADIEAIIKGIDGIIGEMAEGDMEGAIGEALSMGGYNSIAMFQADISMERGYSYAEESYAAYGNQLPPGPPPAPAVEGEESGDAIHVPTLIEKMREMLEEQEESLLAKAAQPLEELFNHHINSTEEEEAVDEEAETESLSMASALETARDEVSLMINEMVKDIFSDFLDEIA